MQRAVTTRNRASFFPFFTLTICNINIFLSPQNCPLSGWGVVLATQLLSWVEAGYPLTLDNRICRLVVVTPAPHSKSHISQKEWSRLSIRSILIFIWNFFFPYCQHFREKFSHSWQEISQRGNEVLPFECCTKLAKLELWIQAAHSDQKCMQKE